MIKDMVLLDGGMGRELERMGAPFRQPEWSALALMEAPHFVTQAHENFIKAGAQIITTNTFAIVPHHIGQARFEEQGLALTLLAMDCALEARANTNAQVKIAASIPPLFGAYAPHLFDQSRAQNILEPLVRGQESGADVWLIETVSSLEEAEFSIRYIQKHSKKDIWVAFCLAEEKEHPQLYDGTKVEDVYAFAQKKDIHALFFNCSAPEDIDKALDAKPAQYSLILGAYPNLFEARGEDISSNERITDIRDDITRQAFCTYATKWAEHGATIIGGCCGIGPDFINALAQMKLFRSE